MNIKKLESKKFSLIQNSNFLFRRMQNRESAVRSRMRKRYYQDELEGKISELEKITKEVTETNAGLAAENALLKK